MPISPLRTLGVQDALSIVRGSLLDYDLVERALIEYQVDTVLHLAAQSLVVTANQSPRSTFQSNITGTWNVLEACRHSPSVKRVVLASSDKAYGTHKQLPYTEDYPLLATNPYDASKACADILARCYHTSFGLSIAVTRCTNIYGGADFNLSRIVPSTIVSLLKGRPVVLRSDGSPIRDYIYVQDAVSAYLTLAENLHRAEVAGQAFNFGTGEPISVLDLVRCILEVFGRPEAELEIGQLGQLRGEIDAQYVSIQKAREVLGWASRWPLREGLKASIRWYEDHIGLFPA